jgi:hypothetical protein
MTHGPINVKSPNNISKWQMGFNSAFKGLIERINVNGIECSLRHFATLKYLNHSGIKIGSEVIMNFREAVFTVLRQASSHSCFTDRH